MGTQKKGKAQKAFIPLGKEIVKVLVGPDAEEFTLHKDRICDVSGYFKGLWKGEGKFKDSDSNATTLAEEDVDGFKLFAHVVYQNTFPMDREEIDGIVDNDNAVQSIIKFYVLADQLILEDRFKQQAIRAFTKLTVERGVVASSSRPLAITSADINAGLLVLPDDDPFLKVFIDITALAYLRLVDEDGTFDKDKGWPEISKKRREWFEQCIEDVSTQCISRVFAATVGFTKGLNMSSGPARGLAEAVFKGPEFVTRYKIGFLSEPGDGMDDTHASKKAKLDDGKTEDEDDA